MKIWLIFLFFLCNALYAIETTTVQSDTAQYDGKEVILKGSVAVENSLGKITSQSAKLIRGNGKSKIDFPYLELCSNVVATFYNGSQLHCQLVKLDYDNLTGFFYGDRKLQIYYSDEMGEIYADQAQVFYQLIEGNYKPVKIILLDNVQLINQASLNKSKEKQTLQYALADYVEFFPLTQTMNLQANEGKKVLFFDKIKNMQLSARLIKGQRDGVSGSQSIQGVGDVRFMFGQDEFAKIKKHFNIE